MSYNNFKQKRTMRDKFIIEQAANGYIVTEENGDKMICRKMDELLKKEIRLLEEMV